MLDMQWNENETKYIRAWMWCLLRHWISNTIIRTCYCAVYVWRM